MNFAIVGCNMVVIDQTDFYSISTDQGTNRIYLRAKGKWVKQSEVQGALVAMEEAIKTVRPRFTVFSDVREVEVILVPQVFKAIQSTIARADPGKVASVWSEQILAKFLLDRSAQETSSHYEEIRRNFTNVKEALDWLDT